MPLAPGDRLGEYEIRSLLGAGGMGEVYRARDLRLKRDVALKVLHVSAAGDADRLRRFQSEAEAAAALNHPNILTVFHIGRQNGAPYIVTELLEGETLRTRLRRGPVAAREALDLAAQFARGLGAAHAAGIVHRDLKPENLFLTEDGRIKILDFGLAKLTPEQTPALDAPTATVQTDPGIVMGTVGYMSPEQVRGLPADHRSDLFAFGLILYEMLSGKRAFQKPTSAETMSAILNEEPPEISQIAPSTPSALDRLVHRCLAKKREQRFQSASDLAFALEALSDSGSSQSVQSASLARPSRTWTLLALAAALVVLAAMGAIWWKMQPAGPRVLGFTQLTNDGEPKTGPLLFDGGRIYFNEGVPGSFTIMQVSAAGGQTAPVQTGLDSPSAMALTADNSAMLVLSPSGVHSGRLWSLPLPAGAARPLGNITANYASLFPDGRIVFVHDNALFVAAKDGSSPRLVAKPRLPSGQSSSQCTLFFPAASPDGNHINFSEDCDMASLWETSTEGGESRQLKGLPPWSGNGSWTEDGRSLLFIVFRSGVWDLWTLREKPGVFRNRAQPVRLTTGPLSFGFPASIRGERQVLAIGYKLRGELVRYDEKTRQFVSFLSGISATDVTFSKDGQWAAYRSFPDLSLWRSHSDGSERQQLTWPPALAWSPEISPDGQQVAYGAPTGVFVQAAGGGAPRRVAGGECGSPSWSPDGKRLVVGCSDPAIIDVESGRRFNVPGSAGNGSGFWVDQNMLVVMSADASRLLTVNLTTGKRTQLASGDFVNWFISPDRNYIDATTGGSDPTAVRIRIADGKVQPIVSLKGLRRVTDEFSGSSQVNVAPDGSLLFTRDVGTEEIYALDVKWP